jgi:hypothetical protein
MQPAARLHNPRSKSAVIRKTKILLRFLSDGEWLLLRQPLPHTGSAGFGIAL